MRKKVALFSALGSAFASAPKMLFGSILAILLWSGLSYYKDALPNTNSMQMLARLAWMVAAFAAQVMVTASLYRIALGRKGASLLGLRFGAPEIRLFASLWLQGMLLGVLLALASAVTFAISALTHHAPFSAFSNLHNWNEIVATARDPINLAIAAAWAVTILLAIILYMRLSLASVATIARNQVIVTTSFDLTHGSVIPLFVGFLVTAIAPGMLHSWLSDTFVFDAALVRQWSRGLVQVAWLDGGVKVLVDILTEVLWAGFLAAAYRQVSPSKAGSAPADIAA